jgi:hypothetical protein
MAMQNKLQNKNIKAIASNAGLSGITTLAGFGAEALSHNPAFLVGGGVIAYICWKYDVGEKLADLKRQMLEQEIDQHALPKVERLLAQEGQIVDGKSYAELFAEMTTQPAIHPAQMDQDDDGLIDFSSDGEDELRAPTPKGNYTFSSVLGEFTPSLESIYLGRRMDGSPIYSTVKGLCHVALAGNTGGGKSSIMRLILSQLCAIRVNVLLLNPHFTWYDLESGEDWTPFKPYLMYDPIECAEYDVIEHYLHQIAKVIMPKRKERYRKSLPLGKPYFIAMDELPAIIKNAPSAAGYIEDILREGRKLGIFLVVAATDFLMSTLSPQGNVGGEIRDNFRTASYVGGGPTTAKTLLDMAPKDIPEDRLGKGTIMIRCQTVKKAEMAEVPYTDNDALYRLLGPSTYDPNDHGLIDDDIELHPLPQAPENAKKAGILSSGDENMTGNYGRSEMAVNAPESTSPDGNNSSPSAGFSGPTWGPDDYQFTPEQAQEFLRIYRKKAQPVKDILRLMDGGKGVSNRYGKYAYWLLRTTGEVK